MTVGSALLRSPLKTCQVHKKLVALLFLLPLPIFSCSHYPTQPSNIPIPGYLVTWHDIEKASRCSGKGQVFAWCGAQEKLSSCCPSGQGGSAAVSTAGHFPDDFTHNYFPKNLIRIPSCSLLIGLIICRHHSSILATLPPVSRVFPSAASPKMNPQRDIPHGVAFTSYLVFSGPFIASF